MEMGVLDPQYHSRHQYHPWIRPDERDLRTKDSREQGKASPQRDRQFGFEIEARFRIDAPRPVPILHRQTVEDASLFANSTSCLHVRGHRIWYAAASIIFLEL